MKIIHDKHRFKLFFLCLYIATLRNAEYSHDSILYPDADNLSCLQYKKEIIYENNRLSEKLYNESKKTYYSFDFTNNRKQIMNYLSKKIEKFEELATHFKNNKKMGIKKLFCYINEIRMYKLGQKVKKEKLYNQNIVSISYLNDSINKITLSKCEEMNNYYQEMVFLTNIEKFKNDLRIQNVKLKILELLNILSHCRNTDKEDLAMIKRFKIDINVSFSKLNIFEILIKNLSWTFSLCFKIIKYLIKLCREIDNHLQNHQDLEVKEICKPLFENLLQNTIRPQAMLKFFATRLFLKKFADESLVINEMLVLRKIQYEIDEYKYILNLIEENELDRRKHEKDYQHIY